MSWVDYDAYVLDPREVRRFIQEHRLSFCGLVSTKVKEENKTEQMDGVRKKNAAYFLNSLENLQQTYEDNLEYYYRSKFNLDSNGVEAIKGNFHIKFKNFELNYQAKGILRNMIKLAVSQLTRGKDCSVALYSSNLELNCVNFSLRFKSESDIKIEPVVHKLRTNTYCAMKDFVEQFLKRCGICGNYPPEIKHLLESLSESNGWYQDVTQHFSLWSASKRRYFIMQLSGKCDREEFRNQLETEFESMTVEYDYRLYIRRDKNLLFKKLQYAKNDTCFQYFPKSFSAFNLLSFISDTVSHLGLIAPEYAFSKISESFPYLFFWLHEAIKQTTEYRKFYTLDSVGDDFS